MSINEFLNPAYVPGKVSPHIDVSPPGCSNVQKKQYAKTIVEFMKLIQKDNPNQFISQNDVLVPESVSPNKSYFDEPDGGIRLFSKARPLKKEGYPFLTLVDTYPDEPSIENATEILKQFNTFKKAVKSRSRLAAVLEHFRNSSGHPYVIEDFRERKIQIGITKEPFGLLNEIELKEYNNNRVLVESDGRRYFLYQTFDELTQGLNNVCSQAGGYRRKQSGRKRSGRKQSGRKRSSQKSQKRSGSQKSRKARKTRRNL